jgi:uncharacterized delta-60 repeat protein
MTPRVAIAGLAMALGALSAAAALAAPADLDPGFGQSGRLTLDSRIARALALQPDGRILVASEVPSTTPGDTDGVVYRLNPSGSLDGRFAQFGAARLDGMNSGAYALALQPDGKVLAVGFTSSDGLVYRLSPVGALDQTFAGGGFVFLDSGHTERTYALALQPGDGKIVVAGETSASGTRDIVVYRLTPGGTLDPAFAGGTVRIDGGGNETASAVAAQPDGKIVVAGAVEANNDTNGVVYRLNADGSPDLSFGQGAGVILDERASENLFALALQPDGRILVAGSTVDAASGTADAIVYRLNANGAPDAAFGEGGRARIADGGPNAAYALALQTDGKILVAGATTAHDDVDAVVYRLQHEGSRDLGFGGDGAARIDFGGGETADALAVQSGHEILVGGVRISGLSVEALLFRLQGGEPAPAPASPSASMSRRHAPVLSGLRITPSAFRPAAKGGSTLPAARRGGALVSFTLDRAASVRFALERAGSGRRAGGRCVKPTRANRRARRCTRTIKLAAGFTRSGAPGTNRFRFTGRLSARRLRPGRYRLVATPRADGLRGDAAHASFRVTR